MKRVFVAAIAAILFAIPVAAKPLKIGVFIPGVREGSPTYSDLALGAEKFVAEVPGSTYKVFEAGFNQAEWEEKLTSFVATGGYDVILTSNPSLPDLIAKIAPLFPRQKFIALDGMKSGVPNLYTVLYNQVEQGYLAGYLAGLISSSSLPGAKPTKKAGMIIGQHYPVMDKLIAPGFEQGLKAADPGAQVDLRVLGNWYDATKASELARSMIEGGVDVILPIAGSASQGVIKASQDAGTYLVFFDSNEYSRAPKHILGCVALKQKELALAALMKAADGSLQYGKADIVGIRDGYIELLDKDPAYVAGLPSAIRSRMDNLVNQMKSGALALKVPAF